MRVPVLVAVGLMLGASGCEEADQIGGQVQDSVEQGVDAASDALSDAGDAISGATLDLRAGAFRVEDLQADLADAADQTGDQARDVPRPPGQGGGLGDRPMRRRVRPRPRPGRVGVRPGRPEGARDADPGGGGRPLGSVRPRVAHFLLPRWT